MKHSSGFAALIATFGLALASQAAAAADGTMTFKGEVTGTTCQVTGGTGTDGKLGDILVTLPTVSTSAFASQQFAGSTPFQLLIGDTSMTGSCDLSQVKGVQFELSSNANIVAATGNLKNTLPTGAENIEIGLLNGDNNAKINLATATAADLPVAKVSGNQATVNFVAQYNAVNGTPTPGLVETSALYTVNYK